MFAIIDIETTGGQPAKDRITEIAIVVHDGKEIVDSYSTLINPYCSIPYNITRITGITNEMVKDAPGFHEVAKKIVEMTENCVFVAHNVGFDYGFVKSSFHDLGYTFTRKTLCTVRMSRSTFKGLPSYSLGNLCESLGIQLTDRHRALGDAKATAILFDRIIKENPEMVHGEKLAAETKKTVLPPQLKMETLEAIPPGRTGVYYFYNQNGDVIYVGKSNDIRKRMFQHFAIKANDSAKAIQMRNDIADISFEFTGSELIALLLESDEIKKIKPIYNRAQKRSRVNSYYGIFSKYDWKGYINLSIETMQEGDEPIMVADNKFVAKRFLNAAIEKYVLCKAKCDIHNIGGPCFDYQIKLCNGACVDKELPETYNPRVMAAIESISFKNQTFFLIDHGRSHHERSAVFIERGQYRGFGYIDTQLNELNEENLRACIRKYPHNTDIQTILCREMGKTLHRFEI